MNNQMKRYRKVKKSLNAKTMRGVKSLQEVEILETAKMLQGVGSLQTEEIGERVKAMQSKKTWQRVRENPEMISRLLSREVVMEGIREFFKGQGFAEVETPLLVACPGTEPYLEVFETELKVADGRRKRGFLLTSPELQMKKLLVAGVGNCFQVCKSFRNGEGVSDRHNSEFTILEWYRIKADYTAIMTDFEEMMLALMERMRAYQENHKLPEVVMGEGKLRYLGREYDLGKPYRRISVAEAFDTWVGLSLDELLDREALVSKACSLGFETDEQTTWEEAYNQIFLNVVEPEISRMEGGVIVYDYPVSQAALSRRKASDPRLAERFEVYVGGLELGNAFSELVDADEQEARMRADLEERRKLGKTGYELDSDFIEALRVGMGETAGIAVGVDRLVMLLSGAESIEETLWFPMREVFGL